MQILKYLEEIKKILIESGCKPSKFLQNCGNRYMICGNIIVVEAKINEIKSLKYGYFLIDKDDKDLLHNRKFCIHLYAHIRNAKTRKKFNIGVYGNKHCGMFKKIMVDKYPFKNTKHKYYIYKNGNPLDLRKASLEESVNRSKKFFNKIEFNYFL